MTERKSIVGSGKLSEVACPKCGAPFPQEVFMTSRITCVHCGSVFQRDQLVPPKPVVIDGTATGQVVIGGHVVGGHMNMESAQSPDLASDQPTGGIAIRAGSIRIGGDVVGGDKVVRKRVGLGEMLGNFTKRVLMLIRRPR